MTGADWARVKDLFDAVLPLTATEREHILAERGNAPEVVEEVRSLLATYDDLPEFLERGGGRRVGAWQLTREIGRGGMGVVWEARRADDQYEQRVAVKLLPAGLLSESAIARFRNERQILASLDHPGIARLLDGGTLEDGSPYLVMEHIEGVALDAWCERETDLGTRLGVFLTICAAVEYAHRRLVIHRDLKPANILVTPEGRPKLLDFGIAKLMDVDGDPVPGTTRLLTPEFASPEQLRGGAITTASDIFALGGLLYLLVTGRKPFTASDGDTLGVMRAVCEEDPPRPGAGAELDAILFQALRKDPDARYPSVHTLAGDVRAWLEGGEVSAVRQPWWRRLARLARRHKTQSAAAALAVVSLLAGSGVSLWHAGVARQQRERAERRFGEVRRFSRSVLFELHEAIRNLPGATAARHLLLERATEFLDGLSADAAADTALKLELAEGYRRLGHVEGGEFSENLGQRDAAIQSFRKAVRLGEGVFAGAQQQEDAGLILLSSYDDLARALLEKQDVGEAELWHKKETELCRLLESRYFAEPRVRSAIADDYSARAVFRTQVSDYAGAKELYRRALAIYRDLKAVNAQYAFASKRLGALLIVDGALEEAERCYRTALTIEDGELAAAPGDARRRLDRTFTLSDLALILKKEHDPGGAAKLYFEVLETRRAALDADPGNMRNVHLTASAAVKLAAVYSELRRHHEAIGLGREALRLRARALAISNEYAERRDAALARIRLAYSILVANEDGAFRAAAGERVADARAQLEQAAPDVPNGGAGQTLSPADRELQADFAVARQYLARVR